MFAYAQTPTIVVVDGVASPEECEAIIDHTKDRLGKSTVASVGGHEEDAARTSTGGFFPHSDFPEICNIFRKVSETIMPAPSYSCRLFGRTWLAGPLE